MAVLFFEAVPELIQPRRGFLYSFLDLFSFLSASTDVSAQLDRDAIRHSMLVDNVPEQRQNFGNHPTSDLVGISRLGDRALRMIVGTFFTGFGINLSRLERTN